MPSIRLSSLFCARVTLQISEKKYKELSKLMVSTIAETMTSDTHRGILYFVTSKNSQLPLEMDSYFYLYLYLTTKFIVD